MNKQKTVPLHWVICAQELLFEVGILKKEENSVCVQNQKQHKPGHFHSMISNWKTNEHN